MDGGPKQMNKSLRRQLSGWIAAVTIISGIVAGGCSFFLTLQEACELQDDQLRQLALLVDRSGASTDTWASPVGNFDESDPDARIIICTLGPPSQGRESGQPATLAEIPVSLPDGFQAIDSHGDAWRLFVRTLPSGKRIAVGQLTEIRNEIPRNSGLRTLIPVLLLIPFLTFLTAWIIRRSLSPVTNLSHLLDQRDDSNLAKLPEIGVPEEIKPFVVSINSLMQRLGEVLQQQRRFIADAAHELRSPLTALTLQAENLEHGDSPQERSQRLQQLKNGLARTRSLLDQLLSLARQQSCVVSAVELHFDRIVRQVLEDLMPMAAAKGIDVGCERLEDVVVNAPAEGLSILVRNAVDNAIRYTPAGGTVDVKLYHVGGQVILLVSDNGPGVPTGEEERLFEPFYRVMGSDETGSGLGLAIVHSIADRLGGTATLRNRENGCGALFTYTCAGQKGV